MNAVVVGATGAVGSALVRELATAPHCRQIVALVRRPLGGFTSSKLKPHVVDLAKLEEATRRHATGCDTAFCTMGLGQPRKAAFDEFWRVDVEYAGAFARGAAAAGVRHISLLSSVGADATSRTPYLRVKAEAERAVAAAGIARSSFFRPSLLVTDQIRYGLQDRVTQALFPLVAVLVPARFHQIHVNDLARAMRLNADRPGRSTVEVLQYPTSSPF